LNETLPRQQLEIILSSSTGVTAATLCWMDSNEITSSLRLRTQQLSGWQRVLVTSLVDTDGQIVFKKQTVMTQTKVMIFIFFLLEIGLLISTALC
jgi:hypothetical protein